MPSRDLLGQIERFTSRTADARAAWHAARAARLLAPGHEAREAEVEAARRLARQTLEHDGPVLAGAEAPRPADAVERAALEAVRRMVFAVAGTDELREREEALTAALRDAAPLVHDEPVEPAPTAAVPRRTRSGPREPRPESEVSSTLDRRRAAWQGSAEAAATASRAAELVELRQAKARSLGFTDAWQMALAELGLEDGWLLDELTRVDRNSRELWRQRKAELDTQAGRRWSVAAPVAVWLHDDPSLRTPRRVHHADVEARLGDATPALLARLFDGIAMNARASLPRLCVSMESRQLEAAGTGVDRAVSVPDGAGVEHAAAVLTGLSHLVASRYARPGLEGWAAEPASLLAAASLAESVRRALWEPLFLREFSGATDARITPYAADMRRGEIEYRLARGRWQGAVTAFSRDVHTGAAAPAQWAAQWAEARARHQLVEPPEHDVPEWALWAATLAPPRDVIAATVAPWAAAQFKAPIVKLGGQAAVTDNFGLGEFYIQEVLAPGASVAFWDLVATATGEPLVATSWLRELGL
jgi:hypothetical protein